MCEEKVCFKACNLEVEICGVLFELTSSCVHENSSFYFVKDQTSCGKKIAIWDDEKIIFLIL